MIVLYKFKSEKKSIVCININYINSNLLKINQEMKLQYLTKIWKWFLNHLLRSSLYKLDMYIE